MNQRFNRVSIILFIGDMLLTLLGLYVASILRSSLPFGKTLPPYGEVLPIPVYILAVGCWSGSLLFSGDYNLDRSNGVGSRITRLITAGGTATILLAGVLYMTYRQVSRLQFVYIFIINLLLIILFRGLVTLLLRRQSGFSIFGTSRVLLIGAGDLGREVVRTWRTNPVSGYHLVGYLDDAQELQGQTLEGLQVHGGIDTLLQAIKEHDISEVWSTLPPRAYDQLHALVSRLETIPVRIKVIPDYFSLALIQARVEMLGGFPIIGLREPVIHGFPRLIKRSFDLALSSLLLIPVAPLLLLIGISIRLDSPGPILFRQTRVGENGKLFKMLKFRTMVEDAEKKLEELRKEHQDEDFVHKRADDPRVTRVGRILRRFSLDELPQLFNVIRGEMSLVGPRPELPWLVEKYKPWQRKRFAVPQGITGWWQINGRSEKPMHLNTDEDLYYIFHYSLWLDIKILLMTPLAVLQGKGSF